LTRTATALMRSTSAKEVPPNFITMRVLPAALVIGQNPGECLPRRRARCRTGGAYPYSIGTPLSKACEGRSPLMTHAAPTADPAVNPSLTASVDPAEIAKFSALAEAWWDPAGKFRPLHRLNPVRLTYIRDRAAARFGREALAPRPLAGLCLVDIGCGGGLLSEPLARMGAQVTGIDAAEMSIAAARRHAEESELEIDYRQETAEALVETGARFEIVLAMEIVEHVGDVP